MFGTDSNSRYLGNIRSVLHTTGVRIVFDVRPHGANNNGNRAITCSFRSTTAALIHRATVGGKRVDLRGVHRPVEEHDLTFYTRTQLFQFVKRLYLDDRRSNAIRSCSYRSTQRTNVHLHGAHLLRIDDTTL